MRLARKLVLNVWSRDGVRGAFWAVVLMTALWALAPRPSASRQDDAVEITFMGPSGDDWTALEDAVREFERLSRERNANDPDYPVYRVVSGQSASRNQTEDPTRFLISLAGGTPPDVIFFDRFAISEWAVRGVFTQLDEWVARDQKAWEAWRRDGGTPPWPGAVEEGPRAEGAMSLAAVEPIRREDFYVPCWDEAVSRNPVTGESGLYGIPNGVDNRCLLYNKDILVRHGFTNALGEAQPPGSWEELHAMAATMTERDDEGRIRTIGFIPNYGNSWLYLYGWQAGGKFMSADGRACTLNDDGVAYALDFMTRIYDDLGGAETVKAFESSFQGGDLDPFILGKVAMKIDGSWQLENLARYGADLDFGTAAPPLPRRELDKGREPISWCGGWSYAIPSTAREKTGAWELIRFLVSQRGLEIFLTAKKFTAESQGRVFIPRQYPIRAQNKWVFDTYVESNPVIPERLKHATRAFNGLLPRSCYRPVTPVGQKLWNAQIWAMDDAIYHKKTAREALDYYTGIVQRDLDAVLDPVQGPRIRSWRWFIGLYVLLVVIGVVLIYRSDTAGATRRGKPRRFSPLGLFAGDEDAKPSVVEGRKGSYFRSQWRDGVVCALPWIIGFLLFTGGPLLFSIIISFCRFDILNPAVWVGFDNYTFMFLKDELFWKSLYNTVFMVIGIPIGMALGLGIAMLLNLEVRGVAVWRTFFYLPSIVPAVAASILWIWILNPQSGLLNGVLEIVGLARWKMNWLQSEDTSKWSLILMGLWSAGASMIIWLAGLKGIGKVYYEAASIDGANAWQRFTRITIPMLTPYIFFNLIMGLIGTFQIFTQAFIMTQGGPANSTLFYAYHLFNNAFRYLQMGYAAAMAWFLFLIVLALTAFQMKLSKKWVHYEGE